MVRSTDNGAPVVPPFLLKCYEMVDDQSTDGLISWCSTGDSFVVLNVTEFQSELLPKFFKHRNLSSFVRQLNVYGFKKLDTDRWEFANDGFIRGQKHLLTNICRRKQSNGLVQRKSSPQDTDAGACGDEKQFRLWKEVECLKTNKNTLAQELIKLRQHQQTSQSKLVVLSEQLKGMEKNQQQMLSFIVMAMQNPGLFVQLLHPKESNWRVADAGKDVYERVIDDCEPFSSDRMLVRYQPPMDESPNPLIAPTFDSENSLELDLTSDEVEDLFMNSDFMTGLSDENFLSSESHAPIILPDLPDGVFMLEQLLLSNPLSESKEGCEIDIEEADSGMEIESNSYGSQLQLSDKFEATTDIKENPTD